MAHEKDLHTIAVHVQIWSYIGFVCVALALIWVLFFCPWSHMAL
jgi:hypothetical protein